MYYSIEDIYVKAVPDDGKVRRARTPRDRQLIVGSRNYYRRCYSDLPEIFVFGEFHKVRD